MKSTVQFITNTRIFVSLIDPNGDINLNKFNILKLKNCFIYQETAQRTESKNPDI